MKIRTGLLAALLATVALAASAAPAQAATPEVETYKVVVKTGDLKDAGTDATVRLTVFGDLGQSPGISLDNGDDNFERNSRDVFGPYKWWNLGTIRYISLGKSSNGSDWYPEYVQVWSESNDTTVTCSAYQWFKGSTTRFYNCG